MINNSYGPLINALPLSLADKTYGAPGASPNTSPNPNAHLEHASTRKSTSPIVDSESVEMMEREKTRNTSTSVHSERDGIMDKEKGKGATSSVGVKTEDDYGFAHPAVSRPQRVVWLPVDTLGLAQEEERACREAGVEVSTRDAKMNAKGTVDISGAPPDMILEE